MDNARRQKTRTNILFVLLGIFIFGFVFTFPLLVMNLSIADYLPIDSKYFIYKEYGVVGDAIGGMTAPLVNLISAILVYLALREQIKANKIIQQQIADNNVEKQIDNDNLILKDMFDYLNENLNNLSVTRGNKDEKGIDAIRSISMTMFQTRCTKDDKEVRHTDESSTLLNLILLYDSLLAYMENSKASVNTKYAINSYISHSFFLTIGGGIKIAETKYKTDRTPCDKCKSLHDFPIEYRSLLNNISNSIKANTIVFKEQIAPQIIDAHNFLAQSRHQNLKKQFSEGIQEF